jgi:hypothetical protein
MFQGKSHSKTIGLLVGFLVILAWAPCAFAPMVAMAIPLAKIAQQADFIIKAKTISTAPASDDWFENHPGFGVYSTRMQASLSLRLRIPGPHRHGTLFRSCSVSVPRLFHVCSACVPPVPDAAKLHRDSHG